jgi:hypothetical protein
MRREPDSRDNLPLPKRTTTVVSSSTSTRTTTDSDIKPNSSPASIFTPNDRTWFNWKDLTTTPFRGRAYQRALWAVAICWILAFLLGLVGIILTIASGRLNLFFFVLSFVVGVVLPVVFPWPVFTEANQYWVQLGRGGYPIRFLKQEMGAGYKTHFIRPYHSVKFYRHNKPLKCEISWSSKSFLPNIELKVTGSLEFHFDPTRAPKKDYLQLLNESDEELEKRLTSGLLNALNQVMQDTVRVIGLHHVWDQGIPALMQRLGDFFKKKREEGYFVLPASSAIYITLPRQIAQDNLKAWAEEARSRSSALDMKVFFEFAGQQSNADPVFKMMNSSAHLRVTVPGSRLIGPANAVLPMRQGGIWVDPGTLTYGNIIQGFSRRVLPEEDIVPAQRAPVTPAQEDDELPRRPPRYS